MSQRAEALAQRIEQGARALGTLAEGLSDSEWRTPVPPDGRTVGVMIHHVATMYPLEIDLARQLADGKAIAGVTWKDVADINGKHAHEHRAVSKGDALTLLRRNAQAAAEAIRRFTDDQLDRAATVSLDADAPLTAQFFIEDHALRHSFHHLAKIRAALKR